jgi:hypothetical protein
MHPGTAFNLITTLTNPTMRRADVLLEQLQNSIELANRSIVKKYAAGDFITEQGDTCRELLLAIEGTAEIHYQQPDRSIRIAAVLLSQEV